MQQRRSREQYYGDEQAGVRATEAVQGAAWPEVGQDRGEATDQQRKGRHDGPALEEISRCTHAADEHDERSNADERGQENEGDQGPLVPNKKQKRKRPE